MSVAVTVAVVDVAATVAAVVDGGGVTADNHYCY